MDPGQVVCVRLTVLQELQAVVMMLHRMALKLCGKVAAFHLENSTAKDNVSSSVCLYPY